VATLALIRPAAAKADAPETVAAAPRIAQFPQIWRRHIVPQRYAASPPSPIRAFLQIVFFPNLRARDRCRPDEFAAVLKARKIMLKKKSLHAAERDRSDRAQARRAFIGRQPSR